MVTEIPLKDFLLNQLTCCLICDKSQYGADYKNSVDNPKLLIILHFLCLFYNVFFTIVILNIHFFTFHHGACTVRYINLNLAGFRTLTILKRSGEGEIVKFTLSLPLHTSSLPCCLCLTEESKITKRGRRNTRLRGEKIGGVD